MSSWASVAKTKPAVPTSTSPSPASSPQAAPTKPASSSPKAIPIAAEPSANTGGASSTSPGGSSSAHFGTSPRSGGSGSNNWRSSSSSSSPSSSGSHGHHHGHHGHHGHHSHHGNHNSNTKNGNDAFADGFKHKLHMGGQGGGGRGGAGGSSVAGGGPRIYKDDNHDLLAVLPVIPNRELVEAFGLWQYESESKDFQAFEREWGPVLEQNQIDRDDCSGHVIDVWPGFLHITLFRFYVKKDHVSEDHLSQVLAEATEAFTAGKGPLALELTHSLFKYDNRSVVAGVAVPQQQELLRDIAIRIAESLNASSEHININKTDLQRIENRDADYFHVAINKYNQAAALEKTSNRSGPNVHIPAISHVRICFAGEPYDQDPDIPCQTRRILLSVPV